MTTALATAIAEAAERGEATWWAAWVDGQVVGDLGIVTSGDRGRFQGVGTRTQPALRQRIQHGIGRRQRATDRAQLTHALHPKQVVLAWNRWIHRHYEMLDHLRARQRIVL